MSTTEDDIAALYAVALEQAQAVDLMLKQLQAERAALAQAVQFAKAQAASAAQTIETTASGAVERAMRAAMPGVAAQAVQGLENAAKPVLSNLATLNREGESLQRRMVKTVHQFAMWRAVGVGLTLAGFLLAGWVATAWQRSELEELHAGAAAWAQQAGKAKLSTCVDSDKPGKPGRLCVQIDQRAGTFGDGYAVIKGY